jgi:chromosome segregation ATPase
MLSEQQVNELNLEKAESVKKALDFDKQIKMSDSSVKEKFREIKTLQDKIANLTNEIDVLKKDIDRARWNKAEQEALQLSIERRLKDDAFDKKVSELEKSAPDFFSVVLERLTEIQNSLRPSAGTFCTFIEPSVVIEKLKRQPRDFSALSLSLTEAQGDYKARVRSLSKRKASGERIPVNEAKAQLDRIDIWLYTISQAWQV